MARSSLPFPESLSPSTTSIKFHIQVITPMFGGGPVTKKNDEVTPIRGTVIRGQLRFWWRATRGANCEDIATLRQKEAKIFGENAVASPLKVWVNVTKPGRTVAKDYPAYALFSFLDQKAQTSLPKGLIDTEFQLHLTYPNEIEKDVTAAVWAWVNFGGIGARTRRGCGSLWCEELSPKEVKQAEHLKQWYLNCLNSYCIHLPSQPKEWPTIPKEIFVKLPLAAPVQTWNQAINSYKNFRQARFNNGRGRSKWPEPDSLRRITGQSHPRHRTPVVKTDYAFPRAELGMPIIFKFKSNLDPQKTTLLPVGKTRMASPLIIKPLAIQPSRTASIIMQLNVPMLTEAVLQLKNGKYHHVKPNEIRGTDLSSYPDSPLAGYSSKGSALEAFINYMKKGGYR